MKTKLQEHDEKEYKETIKKLNDHIFVDDANPMEDTFDDLEENNGLS